MYEPCLKAETWTKLKKEEEERNKNDILEKDWTKVRGSILSLKSWCHVSESSVNEIGNRLEDAGYEFKYKNMSFAFPMISESRYEFKNGPNVIGPVIWWRGK